MGGLKTPCIVFAGYIDPKGYGRAWYEGRCQSAHRVAYQRVHGSLPKGAEVHHRRDTRACVNVEHLRRVTKAEHNKLTHGSGDRCAYGHLFDDANTYIRPTGQRQCRRCNADAAKRLAERRAAA